MTFRTIAGQSLAIGACALAICGSVLLQTTTASADTLQPALSSTEGVRIKLAGTSNTRDLGGYPAAEGKTVRSDMLIRSDSLDKLASNDTKTLVDKYHVNLIVDLRTPTQIASSPDVPIPGVQNVNLDIFGGVSDWPQDPPMYDAMANYDSAVTAYKSFFKLLETHTGGAILFHCSHGMDRTGVVAAMLYHILGVSSADVMTNYLQSNTLLNVTWATPDLLNRWYSDINSKYGSLDSFITNTLGVSTADQQALRAKYLTPSNVGLSSLTVAGQHINVAAAAGGNASITVPDPSAVSSTSVKAVALDPNAHIDTVIQGSSVVVTVTGQDGITIEKYSVGLQKAAVAPSASMSPSSPATSVARTTSPSIQAAASRLPKTGASLQMTAAAGIGGGALLAVGGALVGISRIRRFHL